MYSDEVVSSFLAEKGLYPVPEEGETGLRICVDGKNRLMIQGSPNDYIELADLLISLALSGENQGQHWHLDSLTLMDKCSEISELILVRR